MEDGPCPDRPAEQLTPKTIALAQEEMLKDR